MSNHDFDFLFGSWKVHNRRLREPLSRSTEWVEYEATNVARPVWGGAANMDEYVAIGSPFGDIHGLTLRLYDEATQQWAIYWANRKYGRVDVPMYGRWENGIGMFYDQELFKGRAIFVRFVWTNESHSTARWEQAFSEDGGKSWETNWVMEFERSES